MKIKTNGNKTVEEGFCFHLERVPHITGMNLGEVWGNSFNFRHINMQMQSANICAPQLKSLIFLYTEIFHVHFYYISTCRHPFSLVAITLPSSSHTQSQSFSNHRMVRNAIQSLVIFVIYLVILFAN